MEIVRVKCENGVGGLVRVKGGIGEGKGCKWHR